MLNQLANMTWKNPIFMIVFFSILWYLPGILLRRRIEYLDIKKKKELQQKKINSLYPNIDKEKKI